MNVVSRDSMLMSSTSLMGTGSLTDPGTHALSYAYWNQAPGILMCQIQWC